MQHILILLCLVLLPACSSRATTDTTMELVIHRDRYILDGSTESNVSDISAKVLAVNPKVFKILACPDAQTRRIIDIKDSLGSNFTGDIHFGTQSRGCP